MNQKPTLQTQWDWRAALNFILGGTGAGLMISAMFILYGEEHSLDETLKLSSIILSLLLVAAGLGAVWLEIGRKLRALHVFFNPFTSWMSREAFAAVLLFAFGALSFVEPGFVLPAALAALAFLWCQARILFAAKGIPAWRAPEVVPLVVATGLAEGSGLALLFDPGRLLLVLFAVAVLARAFAWRRYRARVNTPALACAGAVLLRLGTGAALALAVLAWFFPLAAPLAGAAALAAGWRFKFALVTRAALREGFSLPHIPVRGTR